MKLKKKRPLCAICGQEAHPPSQPGDILWMCQVPDTNTERIAVFCSRECGQEAADAGHDVCGMTYEYFLEGRIN